ncbi:glycosyltransferase family 2 protein [Fulvivirga kasyanovii]|uniref:Glycosyltransferase family 2 protein n=1 Tax=Fulvivirga kasyanovii TaxID=396812 RepID=A0ABW9RNA0_9BACT|nr:glycosyltransferase family 2 protein [Fulvivirga kasyanovii]MTI25604.1 glycosyltransferase family 2 protein [Fulvivirga kasyanovii]
MKELIEICFWICIFIVVYSYVGYGFLLFLLVKIKRAFGSKAPAPDTSNYPEVTHVIAAYNEEDCIRQKIENSLNLDYPTDKLKVLIVTDGSTDETMNIIKSYPQVLHYHEDSRNGKIAAVNRIIRFVKSPIIVFSDANTTLNDSAIRNIARHFNNPGVGLVAGEKRVISKDADGAAASGEGFYWKYESKLKQWDSELHSVVGAAGELFAVRTDLFDPVDENIIIEDFYISLKIAMNGHKVVYEPDAYAMESGSASVKEELKRKIRIAAGGIQAIIKLSPLLNIFRYGMLSFQYVSHRVLRWTLAPLALPIIFFTNFYLALHGGQLYQLIFALQLLFYLFSTIGWILQNNNLKFKIFFIPYYFTMMNYAVYRGFFRYINGTQSAVWDKAKRAQA